MNVDSLQIGGANAATLAEVASAAATAQANAEAEAQRLAQEAEDEAHRLDDGTNTKFDELHLQAMAAAAAASSAAETAAQTATNFLCYDPTNGLVISQTGSTTGSSNLPYNTQIKSNRINFRKRSTILAYISDSEFVINRASTGKPGVQVNANYINFYKPDGETVAAYLGALGLMISEGSLGGFKISSTANTGTSANGGHAFQNSLYTHISKDGEYYEHEVGINGSTRWGDPAFYIATIQRGTNWNNNRTISFQIKNNGDAYIAGWTFSANRMMGNQLILDSGTGQLIMGSYQRQSGMYRTKAFIGNDGNGAFKSLTMDALYVGDNADEGIYSSNWNSLSVTKDRIEFHRSATFDYPPILQNVNLGYSNMYLMLGSDGYIGYYVQAPSSKRYKDIERRLTAKDIEKAYDLHPIIGKYKDGYLPEGHFLEGLSMPMFIAEEVAETIPEAVKYNEDGLIEDWNHRIIIPVHHQMILDQRERIDELEKEVETLRNELAEIKAMLKGERK